MKAISFLLLRLFLGLAGFTMMCVVGWVFADLSGLSILNAVYIIALLCLMCIVIGDFIAGLIKDGL